MEFVFVTVNYCWTLILIEINDIKMMRDLFGIAIFRVYHE